MEQPWFRNPSHLFAKNKVLIFWPLAKQTPVERLNAATRFILYTMAILYVINRDIRVIYLGSHSYYGDGIDVLGGWHQGSHETRFIRE
jgi:hypothetical protein